MIRISNKPPKEESNCLCLPLTVTDSVFKLSRNHLPQTFLKECKYHIKKKETKSFTNYQQKLMIKNLKKTKILSNL